MAGDLYTICILGYSGVVDCCAGDDRAVSAVDQWREVERIDIYVGGRRPRSNKNAARPARGFCGSVSRVNGALYRTQVLVQCAAAGPPLRGRYVYVELVAAFSRVNRVFAGAVCDVSVYQ